MLLLQKETQTVAVLEVREAQLARILDLSGDAWTEIRLGMLFSGIHAHNIFDDNQDEDVSVIDASDYLTIGLKDESSELPGFTGSLFLGVRSTGTTSRAVGSTSGNGSFADSSSQCSAVGLAGATLINGGAFSDGALKFPSSIGVSNYSGFYGIKFKLYNGGLGTQSVGISIASSPMITGTDYSRIKLYQLMNSATYSSEKIIAWNDSGSPRELPTASWVRLPFYNSRLRIQQFICLNTSP